MGMKSALVD